MVWSGIFGTALAKLDRASVDPELCHAGSLVHDVGLEHIETGQCFTRRSAEAARVAGEHSGLEHEQMLELMNGIVTHITPGARYADSPIGFYLQAGAMADLAYPRHRIHEVLSRCWHAEAKAVPHGRAHFADT